MGKPQYANTDLIQAMLKNSTGTVPNVQNHPAGQSGEVQTVNIFGNVHQIDVDALKAQMKHTINSGQVNCSSTGSVIDSPLDSLLCKASSSGHELSVSLPDLSGSGEIEARNKTNERLIRGSCADINHTLEDINRDPVQTDALAKYLSGKCSGNSDSKLIIPTGATDFTNVSKLTNQKFYNVQDIAVPVNYNNNRLSSVLESIPLVYIPSTRQLLASSNDHAIDKKSAEQEAEISKDSDSKMCSDSTQGEGVLALGNHVDLQSYRVRESPMLGRHKNHTNGDDISLDNLSQENSHQIQDSTSFNTSMSEPDSTCTLLRPASQNSSDSTNSEGDDSSAGHEEQSHHAEAEDALDELSNISIDRDSPRNTLQRTNTSASSLSSISSLSTGTNFSASAASYSDDYLEARGVPLDMEEGGFMEVNLHSRNSFERCSKTSSTDSGIDESCRGAKPKRRGITGFLSRSLFSRKTKDPSQSAPGWKLFGRVPPKQVPQKDTVEIVEQCLKQNHVDTTTNQRIKKTDIEVQSTTALILENRPMNLPSKTPEEEQKHRLEYEAMVEYAKKKELRECKQRKKQLQRRLREEEQLTAALKVWNSEILPNWDTMHTSKKARDLWWMGIPPAVRGKVWKLAIGNELNITSELYEICMNRAKDRIKTMSEAGDTDTTEEPSASQEHSVQLIELDVSRTFPQLCIFQKGGPYYNLLHSLLGAYACYRPDVGYVQGMSFIAAILLLNMEEVDAFMCFANLLNKPCQLAFFRLDENVMKSYFQAFEEFFEENLPKLYSHFEKQSLTPDLYIIDWMFTLYSKSLPLDVASRVWDVFCRDGEEFLFRTALGILKMYEETLIDMEFIHLAQFLTKLPEDLPADRLFKNIDFIKMQIDKKRFGQVLLTNKEARDT